MTIFSKIKSWIRGQQTPDFRSGDYWDHRYRRGGNSGSGSYGRLAKFKAEVINRFVAEHNVQTIIEHGCGDGAQLELAAYPSYLGLDISPKAVEMCRERFRNDPTKDFEVADDSISSRHDLALSLDVIYHLTEDSVYERYMQYLLGSSNKYLIVYASNEDRFAKDIHVRHRKFTDTIDETGQWRLLEHIPNRYPFKKGNSKSETSFADFYIFERTA